ncbi:hypothetical protein GALL_421800 [mine drainage metagenome]|uniref:Uncharacterized protein n=1 Tax=mine drainage metagenome TaxID=410659 RepID=A0A1J5PXD6_9ZZZZ
MLVANHIGKSLKKGYRRIGVEQPAFEVPPVTAMQIFCNIYTPLCQAREIQREGLNDVARKM